MSFKANNVEVKNKVAPSIERATSTLPNPKKELRLSKVETELLLHTLKNSNFKGEMVEVLYILISKLKDNLKKYE